MYFIEYIICSLNFTFLDGLLAWFVHEQIIKNLFNRFPHP